MQLSESYKRNLKRLSGIRLNEIELKATSGRSEKGTLGYYVEDYILSIGQSVLTSIDENAGQNQLELKVEQGSVRISENTLQMDFKIEDNSNPKNISSTEYSLTVSVNLESSSTTLAVLKYGTLNDEFNLQSKHSYRDVADFVSEIVSRVMNVHRMSR